MGQICVRYRENNIWSVDYYSFFIWERPLPDMQSEMVILALKTIFNEHGPPDILLTDNGCSYMSEDFKEFSFEWNFVHKTLSPRYPRGNVLTEKVVNNVKKVYTKCKDNFLMVSLVHYTTPLLYMKSHVSLAELFFGHRLSSNMPIMHKSNPELVLE